MITFIHPHAFWWLLLAVPLVLFYLWRNRPRKVRVTTGAIWQKALPILHPRRAWQPYRWWVSLGVQFLVLCVLVIALAEPCWRRPQRVAVVLDTTASMGVVETDGQTRLALADAKLRRLVENLGYNDSMALLVVGEKVQIACRMTHNKENLLHALETLPKPGGNASIEEAVGMATSLVVAGSEGKMDPRTDHVVLLSDGCFSRSAAVRGDERVHWVAVGSSVGNVELETLSAERRNAATPEAFEVLAALRNYSNVAVSGKLTVTLGAAGTQTRDVTIPAGERLATLFSATSAAAVPIHAEFIAAEAKQDALTEDNTAETTLSEAFCYRVKLFMPSENALLSDAFRAIPGVTLTTQIVADGQAAPECATRTEKLENGVSCYEVFVYDRVLPDSWNTTGRGMAFAPPRSTPYWVRSETAADYVLMPWLDGLHSGISTAGVGFVATHALRPTGEAEPWIFSQSSLQSKESEENYAKKATAVAMTELVWGLRLGTAGEDGRWVLAACDLMRSDWPLADDFPRFLQYSLDWLANTEATRVRLAAGREPAWESSEGLRDSNLNTPAAPTDEFQLPGEDVVPLWSILAVLLIAALTVEWALYQRRWME